MQDVANSKSSTTGAELIVLLLDGTILATCSSSAPDQDFTVRGGATEMHSRINLKQLHNSCGQLSAKVLCSQITSCNDLLDG